MKDYYRVQANINLDAIYDNVKNMRTLIRPETKLMAIVKADGYGHGAVAVAKVCDSISDAYGVAMVEEGVQLRKAGIDKPILILGYSAFPLFETIIHYELTQTIFEYEMAYNLSKVAVQLGKTAYIHIKLDTGMSRLGFKDEEESIKTILKISQLENIKITGLFTHYACADMKDKTSARLQERRYLKFVAALEEQGVRIPIMHTSNSAAIIDLPEVNMDMVRCGITTYGLYPSDEVDHSIVNLRPAMELKSRISFIKEVDENVGIGYGSTFITKEKSKIATIPVGYADGYPRALSGKGKILVHGQFAPIVGRVCMDQFMVDITGIENVNEGDEVTLVGKDGENSISVEELAALSYSFNYEFVCDISKRVPRVYYRHGRKVGTLDFFDCLDKTLELDDNLVT